MAPAPIAEMTEENATRITALLRKRTRELASSLDTGYIEMADLLYRIWDPPVGGAPLYKTWGFISFSDYAEKELSLHRRKAERLRRIGGVLNVSLAGLDPLLKEALVAIGWSKLRELTRVLSIRNTKDWVDMANKLSYPDLMQAIQKYVLAKAETAEEEEKRKQAAALSGEAEAEDDEALVLPPTERLVHEHFTMHGEQNDIVKAALQRAEELSKSEMKSHNLTLICQDFLANNDFREASDPEGRARYLLKIETLLGVKLVAADPTTGDVVYGLQSLKLLAGV